MDNEANFHVTNMHVNNYVAPNHLVPAQLPQLTMPVAQQTAQPVSYIGQTPVNSFEQMRSTNLDVRTFVEFQKNCEKIARTQELNITFTNMIKTVPRPLAPNFAENVTCLQNTPLYSFAQGISYLTGLKVTGCCLAAASCIAAALCGRVIVECDKCGAWKEPVIIRTIQSAVSGSHKTVAFDILVNPFHSFQVNHSAAYSLSKEEITLADAIIKKKNKEIIKGIDLFDKDSLERLKRMADKLEQNEIVKALKNSRNIPSIITTESTVFALQNLMEQNGGSIFYASDESTGLDKLFVRDKLGTLARSFDQETERYNYRNKEIIILHPSLCMLCYSQPAVMERIYTGQKSKILHQSGILARILPFIHILSSNECNQRPNPIIMETESCRYASVITELLKEFYTKDQMAKTFTIHMDEEAQKLLKEFSTQLDTTPVINEAQAAWKAKLTGQSVRLAAAFHFYRYGVKGIDEPITAMDYAAARDTVYILQQHNDYLVNPFGLAAQENAFKIADYLKRISSAVGKARVIGGLSSKEVMQQTGLRKQDVYYALYLLSYAGWAALYDDGTGNLQVRFRSEIFAANFHECTFPAQSIDNPLF